METQTKDQFNFILKTQETPEIASKLNGCSKWDFSKFLNNFYPTNNSDEEKLSSENKDENKDPEDSNISNYDFSTLLKKIPDDYSDDEYSCLKKEIDSFIQADDTNLFQNYSNQNLLKPKSLLSKCENKLTHQKSIDSDYENTIDMKKEYSLWQKESIYENRETLGKKEENSEKNFHKIFIPKKYKLEFSKNNKTNDFIQDTKFNSYQNENCNSSCFLNSEENTNEMLNKNSNFESNLKQFKSSSSNSSLSTANNSACVTPGLSPEGETNKKLSKRNTENFLFSNINNISKNLYENYFDNNLSNFQFNSLCSINKESLKICHINSFCTKSETELNNQIPEYKNFNNSYLPPMATQGLNFSKINSVNYNKNSSPVINNKHTGEQKTNYPLNLNNYYDTTNITNKNIINNPNFLNSSIYASNPPKFYQYQLNQNQLYFNNLNVNPNIPYFQNKKQKFQNDPINALREQNNSIVRNANGKSIAFDEPHNRINLENILRGKDKRTTLMIRHIPNKYTLQTILEDINLEFKDKYDLFYLPLDFNNNCNLGFAFINFVDAFHILSFYDYFRGKRWRRFNSEKICELAYAKFQGKKELINHFEKGSVMNFDSEDKKPLILPTPNPIPKITLPMKFFDAFLLIYPYSNYEIFEEESKFTINSFYEF